jgi:hypothetical protein
MGKGAVKKSRGLPITTVESLDILSEITGREAHWDSPLPGINRFAGPEPAGRTRETATPLDVDMPSESGLENLRAVEVESATAGLLTLGK